MDSSGGGLGWTGGGHGIGAIAIAGCHRQSPYRIGINFGLTTDARYDAFSFADGRPNR